MFSGIFNVRVERTIGQLLYLAALALCVWGRILDLSMYLLDLSPRFLTTVTVFAFLMILVSLAMGPMDLRTLSISLVLMAVAGATFVQTHGITIIVMLVALIVGAKNVDFRDIARVSLATSVFTSMFVVASALLGRVPNYMFEQWGRDRQALGFRYPLFPAVIFLYAVLLLFWLTRGRIKLWLIGLLALMDVLLYIATDSRFAAAVVMVVLVASLSRRFIPPLPPMRGKAIAGLAAAFYPLVAGASIVLMILGVRQGSFLEKIDRIFGGRFEIAHASYEVHGLSWFGQVVHAKGNALGADGTAGEGPYLFIDNSYVNLLVKYGIVPAVILVLAMAALMFVLVRSGDLFTALVLVVIGLHNVIDGWFILPEINVFILLLGTTLLPQVTRRPNQDLVEAPLASNQPT